MITATIAQQGINGKNPSRPVTVRERRAYLSRLRRLQWTQNEGARRIGKDPGLFSRWLRGELASAVIRGKIDAVLAEREGQVL